jgi:hypothetical protein
MITTPQEYYAYLHQIQSNNPPTLALIPNREKIYEINLNDRTVETPEFLSVEKDHASETVYFIVDRYYDYVDLSQMICAIHYVNAAGQARIYPVPFYDVQTYSKDRKMLIPWNIGAGATAAAGTIKYSIRFYRLNELGTAFEYNLNTLTMYSKILHGMDAQALAPEDFTFSQDQFSLLVQMIEDISRQDLYWTDLYSE